jgi:hypothetical protein
MRMAVVVEFYLDGHQKGMSTLRRRGAPQGSDPLSLRSAEGI